MTVTEVNFAGKRHWQDKCNAVACELISLVACLLKADAKVRAIIVDPVSGTCVAGLVGLVIGPKIWGKIRNEEDVQGHWHSEGRIESLLECPLDAFIEVGVRVLRHRDAVPKVVGHGWRGGLLENFGHWPQELILHVVCLLASQGLGSGSRVQRWHLLCPASCLVLAGKLRTALAGLCLCIADLHKWRQVVSPGTKATWKARIGVNLRANGRHKQRQEESE
mmetsp:Transcript_54473/g.129842  ORF Transcript_54473/g.129842 Transcript_54473/m.129842 type:complete len:221 (-) Transcript_54473:85-747(-)